MTTTNGQRLSARMLAFLRDSYTAAGLPLSLLVVTQGSYKAGQGAAASGSTHDGGGAADLRTWNLPASARRDLCRVLIVELRRRGGCAWYRDKAHGGMDPHIHVILRDEPALSSGARTQVADYDRGRNGLSNKGADYHPRPTQTHYMYPPPAAPAPVDTAREDDTVTIIKTKGGKGPHYLLAGGFAAPLASGYRLETPGDAAVIVLAAADDGKALLKPYGIK